jgi:hypothetical protein
MQVLESARWIHEHALDVSIPAEGIDKAARLVRPIEFSPIWQ